MPKFIRNYVAGGTYFFTLVTSERAKYFNDKRCIEAFLSAVSIIQKYHHYELIAFCVMPDHIHLLMTLAKEDCDFSSRIKEIKRKTTESIRIIKEDLRLAVWQRRFWEHTIRDQTDFQHSFDYIHYNPIKHGYSDTYDWEWSSYWQYYGKEEKDIPEIDPMTFQDAIYSYGE